LDLVKDKKCNIGGQESGWMSVNGFNGYINALVEEINLHRKNFDLQDKTFYMFTDGHNSRECPEALNKLKDNNIRLIVIPSHCSHILQPCDIGIFASLKVALKKRKEQIFRIRNY